MSRQVTHSTSIGFFRKTEKQRASDTAMRLIAEGYVNVHIEIEWTSWMNAPALGPYVGFWVQGELESEVP